MTRRNVVMVVLGLIGLGVATYLTVVHYLGDAPVCAINHGCETVQKSKYAEVQGVPVAVLGLVGYVGFLLTFALRGEAARMARVGITVVGFLFSAYLTYLELFTIHAICQWCVSSAIIMTVLLILSVYDFLSPRSDSYSSLAETPVSSATTAAAGRTRAPASTNR